MALRHDGGILDLRNILHVNWRVSETHVNCQSEI